MQVIYIGNPLLAVRQSLGCADSASYQFKRQQKWRAIECKMIVQPKSARNES